MLQNCVGHLSLSLFSILTVGYLQLSLNKLIWNFHFVSILEILYYTEKRYWPSATWNLQDMSCGFVCFFFFSFTRKLLLATLRKSFAELQIFKNRLRQETFARLYKYLGLEKADVRLLSGTGLPEQNKKPQKHSAYKCFAKEVSYMFWHRSKSISGTFRKAE